MTPQKPDPEEIEAEALFAHLKGQHPAGDSGRLPEETRIGDHLVKAARSLHADPQFRDDLEARLTREPASPPARGQFALANLLRGLARSGRLVIAAGLVAALVLTFNWALRNLVPPTANPVSGNPSLAATELVNPTSIPFAAVTATAMANPGPISANPAYPEPISAYPPPVAPLENPPLVYSTTLQPGLQLFLKADFPTEPEQAQVYTQQVMGEPLTVESALQAAARMGVGGEVYQMTGEAQDMTILAVVNAKSRLTFINTTDRFTYYPDYAESLSGHGELPPFEQRAATAEVFLREHGLLDFDFQVEPGIYQRDSIRFIAALDGLPVRYESMTAPDIEVSVNVGGLVTRVIYNRLRFQSQGSFELIPASQAWQKMTTGKGPQGSGFYNRSFLPDNIQSWLRSYPSGERVQLYGYVEVLQPAGSGVTPRMFFNNVPLEGELTQRIALARPYDFLTVWGQFQEDANGNRVFELEGWDISPFADDSLNGVIVREGDSAYLQTEDRKLLLPDFPAEIAAGEQAAVRGVIPSRQELVMDWSIIQTGITSGGGGGGGGGGYPDLNLTGEAVVHSGQPADLPQIPYQPGDSVEALEGYLNLTIFQGLDGTQNLDIQIWVDFGGQVGSLPVRLKGAGTAGMEQLQGLPVRVWGVFTDTSLEASAIQVERYEQVAPQVRYQAWLGAWKAVTLEGKEVLLFTTQDGTQYVLSASIDYGTGASIGNPGDAVIIEGLLLGRAFGGYPVIEERSGSMAQDRTDLVGYEITSDDVPVIPPEDVSPASGKATVELIELVYITSDLTHGSVYPEMPAPYVQPMWRFYGHHENGEEFEILVQALVDQYLK